MSERKNIYNLDNLILLVLAAVLLLHYLKILPSLIDLWALIIIASLATIPVIIEAIKSIIKRKISIILLAGVALVFSLIAKQWASAVFINLMMTSARILANYTENRSRHAISSLLKFRPHKIKIEENGKLKEIPAGQVKKGDLVVVELGERVPVDGVIVDGQASIDQSSLTGESLPVEKQKGDYVLSSTIIESGHLVVRAEKIGKDTTLEKIIELVTSSQSNKAQINSLADKFTTWYIVMIFVGALALYLVFRNLGLILAVLLVVCADDIAVSIPMAFMAAIGQAAKRGVIIKGSNFLEGMSKVKVMVVDKTGTLTYGRLKVEDYFVFDRKREKEFLYGAGAVSKLSNHPSAKAIVNFLDKKRIPLNLPDDFNEYPGKGAEAVYENKKFIAGKVSFFAEQKIEISDEQLQKINTEKAKGLNVTLIGCDRNLIGFFALADEIRPAVRTTILELKKLGVEKIVMLTGDNEKIAKRVADDLEIDEFHANLLPEDKLTYLKKYLSRDYKTAMIGDGVNDAAGLSLADIGIAMGAIGSDAAIESADIVLMKDDFSQIPKIIKLSKYVLTISRQNFLLWGILNITGLVLVFSGALQATGAAAFNFLTDFLPILNSVKLFRKNPQAEK